MRAVRSVRRGRRQAAWAVSLLASTMLTGVSPALAQQAAKPQPQSTQVDEIVVTAQKREENLQKVAASVQALGTQKLEQLHVDNFNDFVKFLPSVSFDTVAPGVTQIYMRGVASGENGNHSGPLPSVGVYLDEQPITTIQGPLDVHVYDIARVESLVGPQGTLYGASSEAGTIKIITNKPKLGVFEARYDLDANQVDHGGTGWTAEGMVNIPVSDKVAVRLVGWDQHEAGYIDNVHATRTYPSWGGTIDNAPMVKKDYNDVDLYGARAALKIDLDENWTITPTLMAQDEKANGIFAYDPAKGDLKVGHFYPEWSHDRWYQAAMTVQGKVGPLDVTYAGARMQREIHSALDYSDYSFFYDQAPYFYGSYIHDDHGDLINPSQHIQAHDRFSKSSHELRIATPQGERLRFIGGVFIQRQVHHIEQRYMIDGLGADLEVTGWPDTLWLTEQKRVDRDAAVFGELSYDITDKLTATAGARAFEYDNTLAGFFGFGSGYSGSTGEAKCFAPNSVDNGPCTNVDKRVQDTGYTYRLNLAYKIDDDRTVYATTSTGFRPGGVNRKGDLAPYTSDFLTNYELGWRTTWLNRRLRFNGAVFLENWKDFQFSFLGQNGLTVIRNAAQARMMGVETDLSWRVTDGLSLTGGAAYTDAKLAANYCGVLNPDGSAVTDCPAPLAPKGTQLPITPKVKTNLTARYQFALAGFDAHVQGSLVYQSSSWADLRLVERSIIGRQDGYATADLSAGLGKDNWTVEFYLKNAFDKRGDVYRYAECATQVCGVGGTYVVPNQPRTFGVKFGQKF